MQSLNQGLNSVTPDLDSGAGHVQVADSQGADAGGTGIADLDSTNAELTGDGRQADLQLLGTAAIGDYVNAEDVTKLDGVHLSAIYLASIIGSVTATGSLVAFAKLDGRMGSSPMQLKYRDQINAGLGAATLGAGAVVMGAPELGVGVAALGSALTTSGIMGWHMTASIGGADMPVVITVLNSYSGWALCAEGFMLDMPLLKFKTE